MTIIIQIHAQCGGVIQSVIMSRDPTIIHDRCSKCGSLYDIHNEETDTIQFKEY